MTAVFLVHGLPVGKQRPRVVRMPTGAVRTFTPDKTIHFEQAIRDAAVAAGVTCSDGPIGLDVVSCWPEPKSWSKKQAREAELARLDGMLVPKESKPDADNVGKAVADALEGVAYPTDGRVWVIRSATVYENSAVTYVRIWRDARNPPPFPSRWWAPARPLASTRLNLCDTVAG